LEVAIDRLLDSLEARGRDILHVGKAAHMQSPAPPTLACTQ